MSPTPKTIQIFLPGGDPQGIRVAEITTRIVQLVEVPRSLLSSFLAMPESAQVALYFLIGPPVDEGDPQVYIGQTGDLRSRLTTHNKEKDWWQRALVLISRTNSLTQTHTLFLEWHALQKVNEAGRYAVQNGNNGSRPHTPAPLEADCLEIFDTGRTLLATLGSPIFDAVADPQGAEAPEEVFMLTASGCKGRGLYTSEGFVVRAGSIGRLENVQSVAGTANARFRERLIAVGVMQADGDTVVFQKDHLFGSPSMAALALLGRTSNGWAEWKRADGKTLHDIKRADPSADA
ncbi:MAG: GIY-YIG nuclease family protein [Gemmatimonadales bacterium]|nr:GIY-YIG nuclease family protein [Gemmatimonadales bacterium]MDZ4388155.1 GIY-YIG nuclease family protein [Gemmatimonadales bacterium]